MVSGRLATALIQFNAIDFSNSSTPLCALSLWSNNYHCSFQMDIHLCIFLFYIFFFVSLVFWNYATNIKCQCIENSTNSLITKPDAKFLTFILNGCYDRIISRILGFSLGQSLLIVWVFLFTASIWLLLRLGFCQWKLIFHLHHNDTECPRISKWIWNTDWNVAQLITRSFTLNCFLHKIKS